MRPGLGESPQKAQLNHTSNHMNIFYLDPDPVEAARMQCDKHVVKMVLETAQLLSTAHRVLDGDDVAESKGLYKATHKNHPSAVWVRSSCAAYAWTRQHFEALLLEYKLRYGRVHACDRLCRELNHEPQNIPQLYFDPPPQCMPDQYKSGCAVTSYRAYYGGEKRSFAKWSRGNCPSWFNPKQPNP